MTPTRLPGEHAALLRFTAKWLLLAPLTGVLAGGACAFFLHGLDRVTAARFAHPWLLWLLPLAGLGTGLLYRFACKKSDQGNNLLIEEIHQPGGGVPLRMTPLALFSTLVSHLFGASVGREGTAVQMGGSIASWLGRRWKFLLAETDLPILLMCGVAAGFGGVFGTPVAGAVFAAEVLTRGNLNYRALGPSLIAAFTSDFTAKGWGVVHTDYGALLSGAMEHAHVGLLSLILQVALGALCFGAAAALFVQLAHAAKDLFARAIPFAWLRPAIGGLCVVALALACGTRAYLGLGVDSPNASDTTIITCFFAGGVVATAWLWKTVFTALSVGSGLKGGEVTPLFFIGAAMGNILPATFAKLGAVLAGILNFILPASLLKIPLENPITPAPGEFFAALGLVAVFAGAANTPLACTVMALEIFGPDHIGFFALACFGAYVVSGKAGIYSAQRK